MVWFMKLAHKLFLVAKKGFKQSILAKSAPKITIFDPFKSLHVHRTKNLTFQKFSLKKSLVFGPSGYGINLAQKSHSRTHNRENMWFWPFSNICHIKCKKAYPYGYGFKTILLLIKILKLFWSLKHNSTQKTSKEKFPPPPI